MRYLGVDLGLKRIGFAISEGELASPLKVINTRSFQDALEQTLRVIEHERVDIVVVGQPEGEMGRLSEQFISSLKQKGINIESGDETLSSKNALKTMIKLGVSRDKRKVDDAYAATEILQDYIDSL